MQHIDSENFRFTEVYDRMGLGTYYLPLAMRVIIEEHLLPQQLIEITNERVRITNTGRLRCEQIRRIAYAEWQETLRRLHRRVFFDQSVYT
jgi:hypothetical protein